MTDEITPRNEHTYACGCLVEAGHECDYEDEPEPTVAERLTAISLRVQAAQDEMGWANPSSPNFHNNVAHSMVEYGRCIRDLIVLVRATQQTNLTA